MEKEEGCLGWVGCLMYLFITFLVIMLLGLLMIGVINFWETIFNYFSK